MPALFSWLTVTVGIKRFLLVGAWPASGRVAGGGGPRNLRDVPASASRPGGPRRARGNHGPVPRSPARAAPVLAPDHLPGAHLHPPGYADERALVTSGWEARMSAHAWPGARGLFQCRLAAVGGAAAMVAV